MPIAPLLETVATVEPEPPAGGRVERDDGAGLIITLVRQPRGPFYALALRRGKLGPR